MRSKLIAALIAAAISGTAHAQSDPVGVCKDPRGCTDSGGSNSTDSYPTIFGSRPLIDDLKDLFGGQEKREDAHPSPQEQARQQRLQEAQAANNRGIAFANNGDWANSVTAHAEAVAKDPDDPVMRDNLVRARAGLANARGLEAYNRGDFAGAVALFQEAESVDSRQDIFRQNLAEAQAALANAQAQLENQRRDKAAAGHMQETIKSFAQTLEAAPAGGGLDFDGSKSGDVSRTADKGKGLDFTTTVAATTKTEPAAAPPSGDPNVVDGRVPSGLAKPVEDAIAGAYRDAPPGVSDRVRKGFQAVANRDWKVAKAWFQEALNRDPNNAGLKRMIELTDHVPDRQAASAAPGANAMPRSPPPSQAAIDAFFKDFREGRKSAPSEEVRNYVLNMPEEEFKKHSAPPAAAPAAGPEFDPTLLFPGLQSKDDFIMSELMGDMMGVPRTGE